jgi:hypothetical protein
MKNLIKNGSGLRIVLFDLKQKSIYNSVSEAQSANAVTEMTVSNKEHDIKLNSSYEETLSREQTSLRAYFEILYKDPQFHLYLLGTITIDYVILTTQEKKSEQ